MQMMWHQPTDGLLAQFLNRKSVVSEVEDSAKDAEVIVDEASVFSETDAAGAAVIKGVLAADVEKKSLQALVGGCGVRLRCKRNLLIMNRLEPFLPMLQKSQQTWFKNKAMTLLLQSLMTL